MLQCVANSRGRERCTSQAHVGSNYCSLHRPRLEDVYEYDWRDTWWGNQYLMWRWRFMHWWHDLKHWWHPKTDAEILAQDPAKIRGFDHLDWIMAKMRRRSDERAARLARYTLMSEEQVMERNTMFHLTPEQWARHDEWVAETKAIRLAMQQETIEAALQSENEDDQEYASGWLQHCQDSGRVYDGAIGGAYTYTFLPTSVGTIITVTESVTKRELVLDEMFG